MEYTYLSKIEIAELLKSHVSLMAKSMQTPNKSFKTIFAENNPNIPATEIDKYYNIMQELFITFLAKKYFISFYDVTFKDYLKEDDIPDNLVDKNIFAEGSNADDFSKTETINFIRNAICHSDTTEHCKFLIKDGKLHIEIDRTLKNRRFHVVFNANYLAKLTSQLTHSTKLDITIFKKKSAFDISQGNYLHQIKNNLYLRRIKLSADKEEKDTTDLMDFVKHAEETGNYKDFKFSTLQAAKAQEDIFACLGKDPDINILSVLSQILRSTLPLASVKFDEWQQLFCFEEYYLDGNLTYNDICNEKKNEVHGKETNFHKIIKNYKNDESFIFANYIQTENILFNLSTIFYGYLFDTLITDETIKIGKKEIPKNKLRNAFEHSRYYFATNGTMVFLDWKNKDEYDTNWKTNIKIEDLAKFAEEYVRTFTPQPTNN